MDTYTDDDVRRALRGVADSAEPLADGSIERIAHLATRRRRRRRVVSLLGASAAVAMIAYTAVLAGNVVSSSSTPAPPATADSTESSWVELTGEDLGEALGLTPVRSSDANDVCIATDYFTTYKQGWGFCWTPAKLGFDTELDERLIAYQLMGLHRTPELIELTRLEMQRDELRRTQQQYPEPDTDDVLTSGEQRWIQLNEQRWELQDRISALSDVVFP